MYGKLKNYALIICLFVFLFVTLGNALRQTPGAAFMSALSGTPLVIFGFNRWRDAQCRDEERREEAASEIIALRKRL